MHKHGLAEQVVDEQGRKALALAILLISALVFNVNLGIGISRESTRWPLWRPQILYFG